MSQTPLDIEKILSFRKAKMVVKYTSTGQFTGKRTIGELPLKNGHRQEISQGSF